MIQLVFAHARNEFGSHDGMPWPRITQDFKNFKARTLGTTLVMGAKTFQSLRAPLPDRKHIVVSGNTRPLPKCKNGSLADYYVSPDNLEEELELWKNSEQHYSVIGGVALLKQAIPYASRIIHTDISYDRMQGTEVTQTLDEEFINDIWYYGEQVERHWYRIDETTSITENVLINNELTPWILN
ncbi:dihydrofolate reductase [Acinetobacter phage Octan]|uniref:dihydrofolate reductase n=2 Tax=Lazarusvirus kimel TaxID=2843635 RepID=A0A7D3QKY1_9CAUD|nr:dihydrofolate reductase [Acinetobacter phage Octan]QNO11346.1 dihydrofolate reductase [Acinetobacter phage Meroveus]